jgi:hypothetical protein
MTQFSIQWILSLNRLSQFRGPLHYEEKNYASKPLYDTLQSQKRITFIDGSRILEFLRTAFSKLALLPSKLTLSLESPPVEKDNVFIGILSSAKLTELYSCFGDSLFFENIRDFLGVSKIQERAGRTSPNQEIIKTLTTSPDKMIARNNGIVFRAETVEIGETPTKLILNKGSIVNGCQTTMCIVQYANTRCCVPVKVVQAEDSWDIAKSANYQNSINEIDLDLYSGPQNLDHPIS